MLSGLFGLYVGIDLAKLLCCWWCCCWLRLVRADQSEETQYSGGGSLKETVAKIEGEYSAAAMDNMRELMCILEHLSM